jgi:hypothetical protein
MEPPGSVEACNGIAFVEVTEMCHFTATRTRIHGLQRCDCIMFTAQPVRLWRHRLAVVTTLVVRNEEAA